MLKLYTISWTGGTLGDFPQEEDVRRIVLFDKDLNLRRDLMKTLILFVTLTIVSMLIAGCAPPATNTANATNTNANANAKPAPAAPTAAVLLDLEKKAFDAWSKKDGKFFEGFLADNFVGSSEGKRNGKAEEVKMISSGNCEVKSYSLTDEKITSIGADAAVLTSKATVDATCEGKKLPATATVSTLFVRSGDTWKAAYHTETPVIDPKAPPAPPVKSEAKKEEPKKDDKAASNSNSGNTAASEPAKPTPSSNTDALVKMHQAGWEAFKARDAKWFDEHIAASFGFVDPMGTYYGSKADSIKRWTETMKCEGITTVKVSDGFSTAISPTVEVLTLKGSADGTCEGQKNGDLYQTAIYVKEGNDWKLAYMVELPAA